MSTSVRWLPSLSRQRVPIQRYLAVMRIACPARRKSQCRWRAENCDCRGTIVGRDIESRSKHYRASDEHHVRARPSHSHEGLMHNHRRPNSFRPLRLGLLLSTFGGLTLSYGCGGDDDPAGAGGTGGTAGSAAEAGQPGKGGSSGTGGSSAGKGGSSGSAGKGGGAGTNGSAGENTAAGAGGAGDAGAPAEG